jgi:hypothetical protein
MQRCQRVMSDPLCRLQLDASNYMLSLSDA